MDICYTYILDFPNGKSYVGVSKNPTGRLVMHSKLNTPCGHAIRKHGTPILIIVCHGLRDYCMEIENKLTHLLNSILPHGYNQQHGGTGGSIPSKQTRKKMRDAWKNRTPCTEETRKKLSISGRRPCSKEKAKRIAISNTGKVRTKEMKQRMSEAAKNRYHKTKMG